MSTKSPIGLCCECQSRPANSIMTYCIVSEYAEVSVVCDHCALMARLDLHAVDETDCHPDIDWLVDISNY